MSSAARLWRKNQVERVEIFSDDLQVTMYVLLKKK